MSQQKFASNVVEKCLTFVTPAEHQILVNEMLGSIDENEPLQVMMKDQFTNYVVQKVLETCDGQQLELILNRIKIHLNALKKYSYKKHIVARVEKLVVAGVSTRPYPPPPSNRLLRSGPAVAQKSESSDLILARSGRLPLPSAAISRNVQITGETMQCMVSMYFPRICISDVYHRLGLEESI
ncbi:hypothetical protein F0562_030307 [Nyssa sinensis]|uniref:PUM-HD domain-containing protein n=1 Tax=Nyssa sinensis TaxID=561372 RepID=A0A5J5AY10_9ASTE|nr:hypothetical protein F0562_030307 [Nyssa sinensis]